MGRYALMLCKENKKMFILRFKCRDVCNVAYITKKCNLFYYEIFLVNILNIFLLK